MSRLLLSDLFELDNVRTDQYQELLNRRIGLANKGELNDSEKAEKDTLDSLLANYTSVQVEDRKP